MLRHAFPHRKNFVALGDFLQRWNIRGRWWRRRTQDVFKNPLSAKDGRGSIAIRSHGENASLSKQSSANAVAAERHPSEAAAIHIWNPVMFRQPFIQKGVIRGQ